MVTEGKQQFQPAPVAQFGQGYGKCRRRYR
jgi:hypothetical protein